MNYDDANAVAAGVIPYCASDSDAHCIHTRRLSVVTSSNPNPFGSAAHIAVDGDLIWFTGYYNQDLPGVAPDNVIGQYSVSNDRFHRWVLPPLNSPNGSTHAVPWQIRVQGQYVYVSEFSDGDIVRFDKVASFFGQCSETTPNVAPCMSEIHLPYQANTQRAHSIEIRGNKLWWTSTNPDFAADQNTSTIGYINLDTWTPGVYYTGMPNALVNPTRQSVKASYAGIGIDPTTGVIALADSGRGEIIKLTPINP